MKRQGGRRGIFPDEWFAYVSWGSGVQASCNHGSQHALQGDGKMIALPMSALEADQVRLMWIPAATFSLE